MNQLGINHTRPVGHQPYPGFVMNQLDINHTGPVGYQPYPEFVMNQLGINHTRPDKASTVLELSNELARHQPH